MITGARSVGYERIVCSFPRYGLNGHSTSGVLTETEPGEASPPFRARTKTPPSWWTGGADMTGLVVIELRTAALPKVPTTRVRHGNRELAGLISSSRGERASGG